MLHYAKALADVLAATELLQQRNFAECTLIDPVGFGVEAFHDTVGIRAIWRMPQCIIHTPKRALAEQLLAHSFLDM